MTTRAMLVCHRAECDSNRIARHVVIRPRTEAVALSNRREQSLLDRVLT